MSHVQWDPVDLQVFWGRLIAIVDEASVALRRAAFSTVVRETLDFAVVLLDRNGGSVAQSNITVPGFIATLPRTVRHFLSRYPPESLSPGDVLITNDPWLGTGHLPDVSMAMPIFYHDRLIAFAGSTLHVSDIGGRTWSGDSREVFEEGLRIPVDKIMVQGRFNASLLNLILANVRVPTQVQGDMHAQIAAMEICRQQLLAACQEYDVNDPAGVFELIQARTQAAMAQVIRSLPEGEYTSRLVMDSLAVPLYAAIRIVVQDGKIRVDYAGSSPETQEAAINSPLAYTYSSTVFPLKSLLCPSLPNNEGVFRCFEVQAPEGSLLNPRFPAPVNTRQTTGLYLVAGLFAALTPVLADRVVGDPGSPSCRCVFSGPVGDSGRFSEVLITSGGMGAASFKDGLSCTAYPSNCGIASVEMIEQHSPLLFRCKEMVPDSGGAGKFRGGLGQRLFIQVMGGHPIMYSAMMARLRMPPLGRFGGMPGGTAALSRNATEDLPSLGRVVVKPGDRVCVITPGGGGYGLPQERDINRVLADLRDGLISREACRKLYDVDPVTRTRVN